MLARPEWEPLPVKRVLGVGTLAAGLAVASSAAATYSIAAVDMSTGQVGGAITSCVGTLDVGIVYGSAPGKGVIHAQALLDQRGRAKTQAIELLQQGVAPSEIVAQLTAASFDASFESRQYGVVDLMGRSAGFTGADAQAYKHDQQGKAGAFAYSVQGNILTSQKVLDQASAAFEAQGCDLADRLMLALEAGAKNGEGDSRCTDQGIPSDSAFIEVDAMGEPAGSYLKLSVMGTAPQSPLVQLRQQFDAWRKMHPCVPSGGAAQGGANAGSSGQASSAGAMGAAVGGQSGHGAAGRAGADGSNGAAGHAGSAADGGNAVPVGMVGAAAGGGDAGARTSAAGKTASAAASGTGGTGGMANARASSSISPSAQAAAGGSSASTRGGAASTGQASTAVQSDAPASTTAAGCGCNLARGSAPRSVASLAMIALALVLRVRRRSS